MKLEIVAENLDVKIDKKHKGITAYSHIRDYFIENSSLLERGKFQSPSISPSTHCQRSATQNEIEHGVYQRFDYTPISIEENFNQMFRPIGDIFPKTVFFSSGMAAISSTMFFIQNVLRLSSLCIGENTYFESKWLAENYSKTTIVNEFDREFTDDSNIFWLEYPINCSYPTKYPFDKRLDPNVELRKIYKICVSNKRKKFAIVIDYTLFYLPFPIWEFIVDIPDNLDIFLVTSLSKHRGYGLDLTNGGAVTIYTKRQMSDMYKSFNRTKTIMGASITQETVWTMPSIKPKLINQLILNSGENSLKMFHQLQSKEILGVKFFFSKNSYLLTSFIFMEIESDLMKRSITYPYFSDLLISNILSEAINHKSILVYGTSFGFPFTRIFKNNSNWNHNASSLRIAVGYDDDLNKDVAESIQLGSERFINQIHK